MEIVAVDNFQGQADCESYCGETSKRIAGRAWMACNKTKLPPDSLRTEVTIALVGINWLFQQNTEDEMSIFIQI
jgi:hypothetical protein